MKEIKRNILLERTLSGDTLEPIKNIYKLSDDFKPEAFVSLARKYRNAGKEEKASELISQLKGWMQEKDDITRCKAFLSLIRFYLDSKNNDDTDKYLSWIDKVVSSVEDKNNKNKIKANLISIYEKLGKIEKSDKICEELINSLNELESRTSIGVLKDISEYYYRRGRSEASLELLDECKNIVENIDPDHGKGDALIDIVDGYKNIEEGGVTERTLKDVEEETEKCADAWKRSDIYTTVAIFYKDLDNHKAAKDFLKKARKNISEINYKWRKVESLTSIANACKDLDNERARKILNDVLNVTRNIDVYKSKALAFLNISKNTPKLVKNIDFGDPRERGKNTISKIRNPADMKEIKRKFDIINEEKSGEGKEDKEINDPWERINVLHEKFVGAFGEERLEECEEYLGRIEDLSDELKTYWNKDDAYLYMVEMSSKLAPEFGYSVDEMENILEKIIDPWRRCKAFLNLVKYFKDIGDEEEAKKNIEKALNTAREIDYSWRRALALRYLSGAYNLLDMKNKSNIAYREAVGILNNFDDKRKDKILKEFKDVYGFEFHR